MTVLPVHLHDETRTFKIKYNLKNHYRTTTFFSPSGGGLKTYRLELRLVLSSAPASNWSFSLLTDGDSMGNC